MNVALRIAFWSAYALLWTAALTRTTVAEPLAAENTALRCALIDVEQTALGGLLEADLLTRPGAEWLERTEIQKLFEERNLQALFQPDSGSQRASLGQTLKADVLVILRELEEDQKKYAELVVAETSQGLRLVSQRLLLGDDLLADSQVLLKLAEQGIAKARQPITHIFAVPPLINQDLVYDFDYLRSTYATLLEQSLLHLPGVVVVELAEAKAIANEHNLAGNDGALRRRLPIYLLGEYKTSGQGDQRQVRLDLRAQQGGQDIRREIRAVPAEDAPELLNRFAQQLAAKQGMANVAAFPRVEASQLNTRAHDFERLANWEEALALSEASLLLLPEQPEVHGRAIDMLEKLELNYDEKLLSDLPEIHKLRQRALQHLRILATRYPVHHAAKQYLVLKASPNSPYRQSIKNTALTPELLEAEEAYQQEKRKITMRMVRRLAEARRWAESAYLLHQFVQHQRAEERYATRAKLIFQYQHLAGDADIAKHYAHGRESVERLQTVEGQRFLRLLKDSPQSHPNVRASAERMLALTKLEASEDEATSDSEDISAETKLTFRKVELSYQTEDGSQKRLTNIWKSVPLADGMDAFVGAEGVYLFRPESGLKQIYAHRHNDSVSSLEYDGRFLWMAISNPQAVSVVRVIDPATGQQYPLTKAEGLPLLGPEEIPDSSSNWPSVRLTCLEPGRAIIAGYIGRTWLADVTLEPGQKPEVNIFHEAKDTLSSADPASLTRNNFQLRFRPHDIRTLTRSENGAIVERAALIHRFSQSSELTNHPLLVSGADLSLRALDRGWGNADSHTLHGQVFFARREPPKAESRVLYRRGLGDKQPVKVLDGLPDGQLLYDNEGKFVDCAGWQWQRWNLRTGEMTSFGPVPWLYLSPRASYGPSAPEVIERGMPQLQTVMKSSHFGTLVVCNRYHESTYDVYQVLFDGSGQTWKEVAEKTGKPSSPSKSYQRPPLRTSANLWTACGPRSCLAWSPDGNVILTGGRTPNETLQAWEADLGRPIANLLPGTEAITSVAYSPSGEFFASGGRSGTVILWDAKRLVPIQKLDSLKDAASSLEFSSKSNLLAASFQFGRARAWNVNDGSVASNFYGDIRVSGWLGFSPDDQLVLTSTGQNPTRATDPMRGNLVTAIESIEQIAGYRADRTLVGVGDDWDNTLIAWNMNDHTAEILWPRFPGMPLAISPDGQYIAAFRFGDVEGNSRVPVNRVEVWHLPTRTQVASRGPIHYPDVVFSPDGKSVAIAGDNPIRIDLKPPAGTP